MRTLRELGEIAELKAGSVRMIHSDPVHDLEYMYVWELLGRFAQTYLCQGGVLGCYVGSMVLDRVMAELGKHLTYLLFVVEAEQRPEDWKDPRSQLREYETTC